MSLLIHMRGRIKTVETIEKVTHAMQLISMSTHLNLRGKKSKIESYQQQLTKLFNQALSAAPHWHNAFLHPDPAQPPHVLCILIGSQKGLCGTFNSSLFNVFEKDIVRFHGTPTTIIPIGKRAIDYVVRKQQQLQATIVTPKEAQTIHPNAIPAIIAMLAQVILEKPLYTQVIVYNNYPSTFFFTKITNLFPYSLCVYTPRA